MKPKSVFKRFLSVSISGILLVYLLIALLVGIYWKQQAGRQEEQRQTLLENNASVLESELEAVHNLEVALLSDSMISNLVYESYGDNYEKSQLVRDVKKNIQMLSQISSMLRAIDLYIPEQSMKISTQSLHYSETYEVGSFYYRLRESRQVFGPVI